MTEYTSRRETFRFHSVRPSAEGIDRRLHRFAETIGAVSWTQGTLKVARTRRGSVAFDLPVTFSVPTESREAGD